MEKDGNLATGYQRPLNNVLDINVREGAIKNGQSRETGSIQDEEKQSKDKTK
jgi:hypothetical protein